MSGYPVVPPSGAAVSDVISNLTTTMQTYKYPSTGKWASLSYRLLPGATATASQYAKVVFNAASDADATSKLALNKCSVLAQGDDLTVYGTISRIDVVAAAAVGTEVTLFSIDVGV